MSRRETTLWNLFFHYVTIGSALVQGIILVPLYLRYIPLETYGAWLASGNIALWLTVLDPGLGQLLQQKVAFAYGRRNWSEICDLLMGGISVAVVFAALLLACGAIVAPHVAHGVGMAEGNEANLINRAFFISVCSSALMVFSYTFTAISAGLQSSIGLGLIFNIVNIVSIIVCVCLLHAGFGLMAIPLAGLFRTAGWFLGHAILLWWRISRETEFPALQFRLPRELFQLSGLVFFEKMLATVGSNLDSFAVARWLSQSDAAILGLTRRPFELSSGLAVRPSMALMPSVAHLAGAGEIDRARVVLERFSYILVWAVGFCAAGLLVFNHSFVALWVGPSLFAGPAINTGLVLGFCAAVLVNSLANMCWALGNIEGNCRISIAQNLLSLVLLVPGVLYGGLLGVVAAPLVARLLVAMPYYSINFSRLLQLGREVRRDLILEAVRVVVAAAVSATAISAAVPANTWSGLILTVGFFSLLYATLLMGGSRRFRREGRQGLAAMKRRIVGTSPRPI